MRKTLSVTFLAVLAVMLFTGRNAQVQMSVEKSIFIEMLCPVNDYSYSVEPTDLGIFRPFTREEVGKDATVGFGATARIGLNYPFQYGIITPFFEGSFQLNNLSRDTREAYENNRATKLHYVNLPILLGVNYRYVITPTLSAYAEAGVGADIFWATRQGWKDATEKHPKQDMRYKPSTAVACEFGLGVMIGQYISAGVHYYSYGRQRIDYTKGSFSYPLEDKEESVFRNIGNIQLRLGFNF